jgi:outer membrane protein
MRTGFKAVIGAAIVMLVWSGALLGADRVGFINLQRLVSESQMGKAARADIQKLRKDKEKMLADTLKEINERKDRLSKDWDKLDPRDRRDKQAELKRTYEDYQRLVADAKEDLLREDREVVAIILKKADPVLKKVAKKNKYTIILKDPNAIGFLDPSVDITDEVLKMLNK